MQEVFHRGSLRRKGSSNLGDLDWRGFLMYDVILRELGIGFPLSEWEMDASNQLIVCKV